MHRSNQVIPSYHINGLPFKCDFDTISGGEMVYLVINIKSKEKNEKDHALRSHCGNRGWLHFG